VDSIDRQALAELVLGFSKADETEVSVYFEDNRLTRFTRNAIHQNIATQDVVVRIRAIVGGATGVIDTNDLRESSLKGAMERAVEIARLAPADPDFPGLVQASSIAAPPDAFDEDTANASAEQRAKIAADVFATAEKHDFWAAGYVTTSHSGVSILNSRGTHASFDGTNAGMNVKQVGPDSTGFAEKHSTSVAALDGNAVGTVAAEKALHSRHPKAVEPGSWTVILEPPAFGELLSYLIHHFSAETYDEGSSFLSGGLDEKYVGESVTLSDDYAHPLAPGMPFDYEGQPTQRLTLLDRGVAKHLVTDIYWAKKLKLANTGHGLPAPNSWGPQARHVVVASGSKSREQLIAETERGLLISRFWYIRPVDDRLTIMTGMTRDGTFLIENGEVVSGVRNMRFNESILTALSQADFSSDQSRTSGYSYSTVAPTVRLAAFQFSSLTNF
jgi:predicted Zn-dependent protease